MFREMLLIHRNQTLFPSRSLMPSLSEFSVTSCPTRLTIVQGAGIQAGSFKKSQDKVLHILFVFGFLKSVDSYLGSGSA
jgi:hypothetical protein